MPVAATMHVIVSTLQVEVISMPTDRWAVIIEMRGVVVSWCPPTVAGKIRPLSMPPVRRCDRLNMSNVRLNMANMSVTQSMSPLGVGFATEGKRGRDSKSDGGQKHFLVQHGEILCVLLRGLSGRDSRWETSCETSHAPCQTLLTAGFSVSKPV